MAYRGLGSDYYSLAELGRAKEYYAKAFQLREHTSERERLFIEAAYYENVTGELDKAAESYQRQIDSGYGGHLDLGIVCAEQGRYDEAATVTRQARDLTPDSVSPYANLSSHLVALQRFDEARQTIQQAQARKLDTIGLHSPAYALAFLAGDSQAMREQAAWFASKPAYETFGLSLESDTEAYAGHLGRARELTRRAVASAMRVDSRENGAIWQDNSALREAAFGNAREARQAASEALRLAPASQSVEIEAALALAIAGDEARAGTLAQDLNKRYPLDTQVQTLWLPTIHAVLALHKRNPAAAIDGLQVAASMELGASAFLQNISCLYPVYVRGQAYLAAGEGRAAAGEFQKILDHSGIVGNCSTGAMARLGLARANALQARTAQGADADAARVRALAAYQDFLTLWKDADPDIPIYKQAKAEYARLR